MIDGNFAAFALGGEAPAVRRGDGDLHASLGVGLALQARLHFQRDRAVRVALQYPHVANAGAVDAGQ